MTDAGPDADEPSAAADAGESPAADAETYCARCGEPLSRGLVASGRRACCLNATPIAGVCPTHGPVGSHDAVEDRSERGEG